MLVEETSGEVSSIVSTRAERVPVEGIDLESSQPSDRNTRLSAAKLLGRVERASGYDGLE